MSGKSGAIGSGGASPFDINAILNALGFNQQIMHNQYAQLGIGVPSGDPLQAALGKYNLAYAGPGTAEQTDLAGLARQAQALIGQVQQANITNPSAPGSPANIAQAQQNTGFQQGAQSVAQQAAGGGAGAQTGTAV